MGMRRARRRHLKGNSYHDDISSLNCVHVLRETSEKQKGCETKTTRLRRQLFPFFYCLEFGTLKTNLTSQLEGLITSLKIPYDNH